MRRLLLLVLVAATAAVGCSTGDAPDPPRPSPERTYTVPAGPPAPATGSYFGAWVMPHPYSQPARVSAVQQFEGSMGRDLDVVHIYRTWQQGVGTPSDLTFARRGDYLLLSWAGVDTRRIVSGVDDDLIRARAEQVKALPTQVFLRWRWEMDRPILRDQMHSGPDYIAAWKHIRAIFTAAHVGNVGWVWCPTAAGFESGEAQAFYPGDDQVDWVCADVYPEKPWVKGSYESFSALSKAFLDWAAGRPKPVMIGEYGVPRSYGSRRAEWLTGASAAVKKNRQIKALLYFAGDQPNTPVTNQMDVRGDDPASGALEETAKDRWFNQRPGPR